MAVSRAGAATLVAGAVVLSLLAWHLGRRPPTPALDAWNVPSDAAPASEAPGVRPEGAGTRAGPGDGAGGRGGSERGGSERATHVFGLYAGWSEARGAAADALVVDVEGAVNEPGVYVLPLSSRVWDALRAAGGAAERADTAALNLARPLEDGEQLYVPRRGEIPPPAADGSGPAFPAGAAGGGEGAGGGGAGGGAATRVDLNRASARQLEELPGIGPALAARIVAERTAHGAFKSLEDLAARVSGIGPKSVERLKPFVVVR